MKLPLSLTVAALVSFAPHQCRGISEPECRQWTAAQLYNLNSDLKLAEDAYVENVAGVIEANCLDPNSSQLKNCGIGLGESTFANDYSRECTSMGGIMWQYWFSPKCGEGGIEQWIEPVLVCASPQCTNIGVQNLIPNPRLLDPLIEAGYSCGTGTNDLKQAPKTPLNASAATVGSKGFGLLIALAAYFTVAV